MPHDLFTGIVNPRITVGGQKWYTVPLSIVVHTVVIAAIIIAPLMATDGLPQVRSMLAFVAAAPPPPSPPPPVRRAQPLTASVQRTPSVVPLETPNEIVPESDVAATFEMSVTGPGDTGVPGSLVGIVGGLPDAPPGPPLAPQEPVRPGGNIKRPVKIRDVQPTYPAIAQLAHVQGLVILEATIGVNGRVTAAKVLRSIPLLDRAALDAVRQWEFTPTLLNGVPVPLVMTVTVQFSLQ
jgi:protein TonB